VVDELAIGERFRALAGELDERQRRLWAAAEARSAGRGGIAATARATGIAADTIRKGIRELESGHSPGRGRVRRLGAGRKRVTETDPELLRDLERLVDAGTRGDPELPLRWTSKSVRKLADGLAGLGHKVSYRTVARLLRALGYSLQANRKTHEGADHPARDAQFELINETAKTSLAAGEPVISVDTKKQELIGQFKNDGREWAPAGVPIEINTHDFPSQAEGKAIPYGVYDLANDEGWVSVGIDHDTSQFAAASILAWWENLGQQRFPNASALTITADCGGSNGNRTRRWKTELQRLADRTGLQITVRHFPPGTSKWNKAAWAAAHQGTMKCCRRSAGRGSRLDSGAQLNPQQVWRRAAGPRIVATSTNPRFGSHQGPSPAGRLSTPSGRRQQCSRSMIGSPAWTFIAIALSRASATWVPGAA
jgi:Rhodopirellula transposase DDE domain